ncbi:MAG: flagellar hook-associated protein FlgK [Paracoccaceae bacterium]|nr:flagellar hook-associated protein FlgK [Paracoccaceae bacterium]
MSISATLANALTGLTAAARSAQVVSTNVSNATTEGYARREIDLSARLRAGDGYGVQVDGVNRIVDENVVRERRLASAAVGFADAPAGFFQDVMDTLGQPNDPSSLTARVAAFESALLESTSRPESDSRLFGVLNAATSLANKLNNTSDQVQILRQDADREIGTEIERLNATLQQIAEIDGQILRARGSNRDYPALLDGRQKLIDDISELVPLRQLPRENDTVALYTMTGALLLDIEPAEFGFTRTEPITPDMTLSSGALSGLTLNGTPLATSGPNGPIAGGRLASLFAVRDELSVTVQSDLDAMARDLVTRFEDPTLDTTLLAGDPGLFTDRGAAFDASSVTGLAGRVSVNALADPSAGGEIWRLRDGLGAAAPGSIGDAALLSGMLDRLQEARVPVGGTFSAASRSTADLTADILSRVGQDLQLRNDRLSFEQSRYAGLDEALLAEGVDTDQEMQKLLLIEQAYAANARVIQTADELIQLLIRL